MNSASRRPVAFSTLGARAQPPTIARLMAMALETPGVLSLAAGFTDTTTLPVEFVESAVHALARRPGPPEFLQYGTNQGRPALRRILAERLNAMEPGLDPAPSEADVMVTNGSQQALYLAMQVLCEPGDIVLVDRPSYFVFLEMLAGLGVRARSLPVDREGRIDAPVLGRVLDECAARGETGRIKALYFVSYFSNPSARSLAEDEKIAIAETLTSRGMVLPVIEDAAYRELFFENPCAARGVLGLAAWRDFPVFYTATLTKPFATGLKVGYGVCTDRAWREKMLHVKGHHDFGTSNFAQAVLEHALSSGGYDEQLARVRPAYRRKMEALHAALVAGGLVEKGWRWAVPGGGLYLWLEAPRALDTGLDGAFCRTCREAGVLYVPGELCFGDDAPRNFARLSFGVLGERDLAEAGRRFAAVAQQFG